MNARNIYWTVIIILIFVVSVGIYFNFLNPNQNPSDANFHPQQTRLFEIKDSNNKTIDVQATTLPQFALKLADQKFQNLWLAHAEERKDLVQSDVMNDSHKSDLTAHAQYDDKNKQVIVTPEARNDFKPGLYHLNVKVKTSTGKYITVTQDFTWGVLAINTSKARYQPGDLVKIGMGVLDNFGNTKCIANGSVDFTTAKIWLDVTSPTGKTIHLSTDEGTIVGSKECAPTSITNNPDFQAQFRVEDVGRYRIHMTAENINGKRSVEDSFVVQTARPAFDVMRTSYPTRIYPYGHYPVEITVIANQDYGGVVSDFVPANFTISNLSDNGKADKKKEFQQINWNVDWHKGQTYKLTYDIAFPIISPEFYLVGPLKIGNYDEGRDWQIASDAINLEQSNTNVSSANASTVAVTLPNSLTANNMVLIVCAVAGSSSINTPTTNGATWSTGFSVNTSSPRIRAWYHLARATESKTYTCRWTSSNTNPKAIQVFEYSGLSTSTIRDQSNTKSATSCSGGTFSTTSITTGNPIELIFASEVGNGTPGRTVNSHSAGFNTQTAFNGTFGTFTSADQYVSSIATYSDTVTFSGGAGTCAGGIVSFNTPISVSQNGFRFFQNANSVTPGTPIDIQNANISLPTPHSNFRLRLLLDVDGTQTVGLQTADFVLNYATMSAQVSGCDDPSLTYDLVSTPGTGTDIAFSLNAATAGSGTNIVSSGNDPSDSTYTTSLESYYEDDDTAPNSPTVGDITNDQNAITGNHAGLWDFSLIDNTNDLQSNTYCLKITNADGSDLSSYVRYPQVTTFYNEVNIKSGTVINGGTIIN